MKSWASALFLEKGHLFAGEGFGAQQSQGGEAVFNTGLTGYQEIFTDPSYYKQIVVMTYPHIGNTGTNGEDLESASVDLSGVVVREFCPEPSSWRANQGLGDYLNQAGVPGISGVDTRRITQILRDEGAQRAVIFPTDGVPDRVAHATELLRGIPEMEGLELVSRVSCKKPYEFEPSSPSAGSEQGTVAIYDYGVKTNTLRCWRTRGFRVWVVPYNYPKQEVLNLKPSAVLLSNGPGDPALVDISEIQGLVGKVPIMAICMGHQLLARVLGAATYKLKFGHHGINHPVKDLALNRILITSQNHGFAVKAEDLKMKDVVLSHINLNDHTVEGFVSEKMGFYSVQFHPESKPGPNDAVYIFDHFIRGFLR